MLRRRLDDTEMRKAKPRGAPRLDLVERAAPRLHVDVGRRRDGGYEGQGRDPDARGVAREARPVGAEERNVMGGMARRRQGVQVEDAVADPLHGLGGNRSQLAPQAVEVVTVEPAGAPLEPARVDEMRRPHLAHVYSKLWIAAGDEAGRAGVVEVDVREDEVAELLERQAALPECSFERSEAAARPAVDQRRLVSGQEVGRDDPRAPEVKEVEKLERSRSQGLLYSTTSVPSMPCARWVPTEQ